MLTAKVALSFQALEAAVGSAFVAHTQCGTLELTLVEAVESARRGLPEQFRTPVSLVFAGPASPRLAQDNYFLDHPSLGRLQWVLVPISEHAVAGMAGRALYEAILN